MPALLRSDAARAGRCRSHGRAARGRGALHACVSCGSKSAPAPSLDALRRHRRRIRGDARARGPARCGGAIEGFRAIERESPVAVTRAQGVAANDAMDHASVRPEIGVTSIQPLLTARSAPLPAGERADKRVAHWRQVAIAAVRAVRPQSGARRAAAAPPGRVACRVGRNGDRAGARCRSRARRACPAPAPLALLIGPEGGLDEREVRAARARGFHAVRLGRACCARRRRQPRRWPCCSRRGATGDVPRAVPLVIAAMLSACATSPAGPRRGRKSTRSSCSPRTAARWRA